MLSNWTYESNFITLSAIQLTLIVESSSFMLKMGLEDVMHHGVFCILIDMSR